jgi:tetratricopeptide (TPR) repeat protein
MKETAENPEIPADDSLADAYGPEVKPETDDHETWENAHAYAALGMLEEAEAFARAIPPTGDKYVAAQSGLCRIYHGQQRYEEIVRIGRALIAEGRLTTGIVEQTMLALTFLGRHREARETLALVEALGRPLAGNAYQMACFASLEGDFPEAMRWLEIEARNPRYLDARAMGDSDLLPLWRWLASGRAGLEDAHRLVGLGLPALCRQALDPRTEVQMDQNDLKIQPPEFRRLFKFNHRAGLSELDALAVAAHPEDEAAFREARHAHLTMIAGLIDKGVQLALRLVADAQPRYAAEQAAAGNHLGVRYHLTWALACEPKMLAEFQCEPGLAQMKPLIDSFEPVLRADPWFCRRFFLVLERSASDLDDAWRMLEETPQAVRWHPLFLLHQAMLCGQDGDDRTALPLYLQVIAAWPEDAAAFANATRALMQLDAWEGAAAMLRSAPDSYRRFRLFHTQQRELDERRQPVSSGPPAPFRGQRDLGGILLHEDQMKETTK